MIMRHIPSRFNKYCRKCHISKCSIFGNKMKENEHLNRTEIRGECVKECINNIKRFL